MITVINLAALYAETNVSDGDVARVLGFRDEHDGGGGIFVFEANSTLQVQHLDRENQAVTIANYYQFGFSDNYDGMICKATGQTTGRWIRQWDRGKLNLRWFGGAPGNAADASLAMNVALKYAQFDASDEVGVSTTIFNDVELTSTGKTIFIPSGRYYFKSPVITITKGVVLEGEGNMGTSSNGTRLLIWHSYDENIDQPFTGIGNERYGFLRFYATDQDNSGGGLKNLSIEVGSLNPGYNANVVTLIAPSPSSPYTDTTTVDPAVTNWTAENLFFSMKKIAKRAIYMHSYQVGGNQDEVRRVRNIALINCWFSTAGTSGQTVYAYNVFGLQVIGGFFASGAGVGNDPVAPGIFLGANDIGCKQVSLNGVDLTHGIIKIHKSSSFVNIDCRYGLLEIYDGAGSNHEALQVTQRHVLNRRTLLPSYLEAASNGINITSGSSNNGYRYYNNSTDISDDQVWD